MKTTFKSRDYNNVIAKSFDVLVDPDPARGPVMALLVEPKRGEKFLLPINVRVARDLAAMILDTVSKVAPELIVELLDQ